MYFVSLSQNKYFGIKNYLVIYHFLTTINTCTILQLISLSGPAIQKGCMTLFGRQQTDH